MRRPVTRIRTGAWPGLSPTALNTAASTFDARYQFAFDLSTFTDGPATPAFTEFTPPKFLRPSP